MGIYQCGNCGSEVSSTALRYGKDGKTILCRGCHTVLFDKGSSHMVQIPSRRDAGRDKIAVICEACKYKFRAKKLSVRCPNCDAQKIMRYETDIEKILKELQ